MAFKMVICVVVLLLPALVFAQEAPVATVPVEEPTGVPTEGEAATAPESETTVGGELTTEGTAEEIGEETAGTSVDEPPPIIIDENDSLYTRLTKGHRLFMQNNYPGALTIYESAKTMDPSVAEPYVFMSYALAKLGRYDDALVVVAAAAVPMDNQDESMQAKALFTRVVIEEMRGPSDAVKEGWMAYELYAQNHENAVTFVSTAKARLGALKKIKELDDKYQIVRERIEKNSQ
jgi:tetratricopeptide (TPR) repeat protein